MTSDDQRDCYERRNVAGRARHQTELQPPHSRWAPPTTLTVWCHQTHTISLSFYSYDWLRVSMIIKSDGMSFVESSPVPLDYEKS